MKILKPGKVEMRKFVCEKCGCVFIANPADKGYEYPEHVKCPQDGCGWYVLEHTGEPYEEPAPMQTQEKIQKLAKITEEFLNDNVRISYSEMDLVRFAKHLIAHGVTFKEDP